MTALPQSTRGIRALPYPPPLANPREKWATVSLFEDFFFFPPMPKVFSSLIFQLNCYFVDGIDGPPSVYQGKNGSPPPSPPTSCVEKAVMVSFPLVFIFPHHSNFFSPLIFQLNCYSVGRAGRPPSLIQGNNGSPPPSPLACCMDKAVMVSFPLVFIFSPPFQFVSHHFFS